MKSVRKGRLLLALTVVSLSAFAVGQRAPTVTYGVSGSSGNWTLNFNVQNNFLSGEGNIYFFGVLLDTGRNIVGSPDATWNPNTWTTWVNAPYGGSSLVYNNNWIGGANPIVPGAAVNGFQTLYTGTSAPSQVNFFAYAESGTYGGNDYFNSPQNPGFEGLAHNAAPEPMTLIALGVGALGMLRKRRKTS